jgi:dUTP pyrophosphatase
MSFTQLTIDDLLDDDDHPVLNMTLDPGAQEPRRMHADDAGADLMSIEDVTLSAGERRIVHTGVHIALDPSMLAYVVPRSGLAAKHGITITNAPGLIDTGYRGGLGVCLQNTSSEDFEIHVGDRIAQLVVQRFLPVRFRLVDALDETERGDGSYGSTGVQRQ